MTLASTDQRPAPKAIRTTQPANTTKGKFQPGATGVANPTCMTNCIIKIAPTMMMASPLAAQRVKNPIIRARAPNGSTNEQRGTLEYCFFYLNMVWGISHIVSLYFNFNLNSIFISHATGWTNKQWGKLSLWSR
jgi:hypothetical protein